MNICKKCGRVFRKNYEYDYCKKCKKHKQKYRSIYRIKSQKKAIMKLLRRSKYGYSTYEINNKLGLARRITTVRKKLHELKEDEKITTYFNPQDMKTKWIVTKWKNFHNQKW